MGINRVKYLVVMLSIVFFNSMCGSETVINIEKSNSPELFKVMSPNPLVAYSGDQVVSIADIQDLEKEGSDVLEIHPSKLDLLLQKIKNSEYFNKAEGLIANNAKGIKMVSAIGLVLLLHFYYKAFSSLTFSAQLAAGKSITEYSIHKKMNQFLMALVFAGITEAIYYATLATNCPTGLATVSGIAFCFSLIKHLDNILERKMADVPNVAVD